MNSYDVLYELGNVDFFEIINLSFKNIYIVKTRILSYFQVGLAFIPLSSCLDDDEPKKDVTNEISMTVSSETGCILGNLKLRRDVCL